MLFAYGMSIGFSMRSLELYSKKIYYGVLLLLMLFILGMGIIAPITITEGARWTFFQWCWLIGGSLFGDLMATLLFKQAFGDKK